jgi:hypothetical protein
VSTFFVLLLVVFLSGCAFGAFVVLLVGIRTEERHESLHGTPRTLAGTSTRRVLAHVRQPDDDITKFAI